MHARSSVPFVISLTSVFQNFYGVTAVRNLIQPLKDSEIGLINCTKHG